MQRLSENTIARALYYVRAEIIREGTEGLEHVEALLVQRGHDPEAYHVHKKLPRMFKGRNMCRRAVVGALRQGPATSWEVCHRIALSKPEMDAEAMFPSVAVCLSTLKRKGVVERGREWPRPIWRLAP